MTSNVRAYDEGFYDTGPENMRDTDYEKPFDYTGVLFFLSVFFFQAEDGIRDGTVTGVQTCALPIWPRDAGGRVRPHAGLRGAAGRPRHRDRVPGRPLLRWDGRRRAGRGLPRARRAPGPRVAPRPLARRCAVGGPPHPPARGPARRALPRSRLRGRAAVAEFVGR